jgi:hypothetical protein
MRNNVDSVVIILAMVVICVISYIAYTAGKSDIVNDCLKLNQFQKDGRVFNCYPEEESGGEDA